MKDILQEIMETDSMLNPEQACECGMFSESPWDEVIENIDAEQQVNEGISFDKFMDDILISEGAFAVKQVQHDSPQRIRAARHQDRPNNKIVIGGR